MKAKSGFTLVEILIVVVILGILAAIVIPQFTEASTEARASSLVTDLQTMRSQIELYKIQHKDAKPGIAAGAFAEATFVAQMTTQTDVTGAAYVAGASTGPFGPYLQKIPTNPFSSSDSVIDYDTTPPANASTDGWCYSITTGEVWAANDTNENDEIEAGEL